MKKSLYAALVSAVAVVGMSAQVQAAALTPGNLVVYRVGSGTGSLTTNGNPVFLDEYTQAGSLVQSISTGVFASGTSTSEGILSRSTDGKSVVFAGYETAVGAAAIPTINVNQNNPRLIGRLLPSGAVGTMVLNTADFLSGNQPRSVASPNGTDIYMGSSGGGVRYYQWPSNVQTQVTPTGAGTLINIRTVAIAGGQLYGSSQSTVSSVPHRIYSLGTGLPTTTGTATPSLLPGIPSVLQTTPSSVNSSPYQFVLLDLDGSPGLDTMYVADDTTTAITTPSTPGALPGIQKWTLSSGTWVSSGTVTAAGVRGLTAFDTGAGIQIFGVTESSLYSFVDTTGFNGTVSGSALAIASSSANTAMRGVAVVPVPEPTTFAVVAAGAGLLLARRRQA